MSRKKILSLEEACAEINEQYGQTMVTYSKHNFKRVEDQVLSNTSNLTPVYKEGSTKAIGYKVRGTKGINYTPPKKGRPSPLRDERNVIFNSILMSCLDGEKIFSATVVAKEFGFFKKNIYEFKTREYSKEEIKKLKSCSLEFEVVYDVISIERNNLIQFIKGMNEGEMRRALLIFDPSNKTTRTFKEYFNFSGDTEDYIDGYRLEEIEKCEKVINRLEHGGVGDISSATKKENKRIDNLQTKLYGILSISETEKFKFNEYIRSECEGFIGVKDFNSHTEEELMKLDFVLSYRFIPINAQRKKKADIEAARKFQNKDLIEKIWKEFNKHDTVLNKENMEYIIEHCIKI